MQIITPLADRLDVPFSDIQDMYRNDLIQRNTHSLEIMVDPDITGIHTKAEMQRLWPLYDVTSVRVLKVEDGYGRHVHDKDCPYNGKSDLSCLKYCDDSDWIVTLEYDTLAQYGPLTHRAVYGVIDGKPSLWMD